MNQPAILNNATKTIYDRYAGMLFGYILEIVKDKEVAERYLVEVFNELPNSAESATGITNTYIRLQLTARKLLAGYFETVQRRSVTEKTFVPQRQNKYLANMSPEEQQVFCNVHYHGKSVSALAAELNKPEQVIKKILQQAFAVIRRSA